MISQMNFSTPSFKAIRYIKTSPEAITEQREQKLEKISEFRFIVTDLGGQAWWHNRHFTKDDASASQRYNHVCKLDIPDEDLRTMEKLALARDIVLETDEPHQNK